MNKRKYPYGLDMCPQLKIHVGDKEVANGVMRTSKMSEIYEKTKQLLFQRARAPLEAIVQTTMIDSSHDSKQFKQLQLTFDGKLSKPGFTNKNSKMNDNDEQKCNFCSQTEKLDYCGKCRDIFCNMCSFSLYSNSEVNKICLTCYK